MKVYNQQSLNDRRRQLRQNQTHEEGILWRLLRRRQIMGVKFFRQSSIEYYIADFYAPSIRLVIEIDGMHHFDEYHKDYDEVRSDLLRSRGITVLRFRNSQIRDDLTGVVDRIIEVIEEKQLSPNPSL